MFFYTENRFYFLGQVFLKCRSSSCIRFRRISNLISNALFLSNNDIVFRTEAELNIFIWLLVKLCLRDTAGSPERARWLHLARSGSQSQRAIWFILPARGTSHIINTDTMHMTSSRNVIGIKHTANAVFIHAMFGIQM